MEIFRLNFYKRHLGDIAKSCSDLSQGQMGAYDLLLDWHYANEKPLPLSDDKLYRIARAVTQPERSNVDSVISELFTRTDDGYTHKRAAEEMSKASAQADTNRRIAEEREARRRATNEARSVHETLDEACTKRQPNQTPDSRLHKEQEREIDKREGSPAGDACKAMREAGCDRVNPSHPELLAALSEGVKPKQLADAVAESIVRGIASPFAYAIKAARSLHAAGASPTPQARASPKAATLGKTAQAIQALEDMKHGNRLGIGRDFDGNAEAHPVIAGKHAGS